MAIETDQKSQIELEVILRDSASTVLKQMASQFDRFNKQVLQGGNSSSKAWDNFNKVMGNVEEGSKKATRAVTGLSGILGAIPKQLLGPLGLAAGLYEVGKALTSFTSQQAALRNMAEDAGYTMQAFKQLQNVFELMGNSPDVARQKLIRFGETMQDLRLNQIDAKFFKNLADNIIGGSELAHKYLGMVNKGTPFEEIYSDIAQEHNKQQQIIDVAQKAGDQTTVINAKRLQSVLEGGAGSASDLSQFEKRRQQARPVTKFSAEQIAAQERANDAWILMWQQFYNNLDAVKAAGTLKLMDTFDSLMAPLEKLYNFASQAKAQMKKAASGEGLDPRSIAGRLHSGGISAILPSSTMEATQKLGLLGGIKDILKRMEDKTNGLFRPYEPSSSSSASSSGATAPFATPSGYPSGGAAPLTSVPPSILSAPSFSDRFTGGGGGGDGGPFMSATGSLGSRAEGGSVSRGKSYLVGEQGPEVMQPDGSSYYDMFKESINNYKPSDVGMMNLLPLGPGSQSLLKMMKLDSNSGHHVRSFMRSMIGLNDPREPAPWQHGQAARQRLDHAFSDVGKMNATGTVNASVDFSDVPSSEKREIFLPVDISTAPKAAKTAISYDKWAYQ